MKQFTIKMNFKYNLTCTKQCNDEVGDQIKHVLKGHVMQVQIYT